MVIATRPHFSEPGRWVVFLMSVAAASNQGSVASSPETAFVGIASETSCAFVLVRPIQSIFIRARLQASENDKQPAIEISKF
jgi:hypothetical protein